jgi:hypothetical protein
MSRPRRRPMAEDFARFRRNMRDNIRRTGRTIIGVFPDEKSVDPTNEAFAYTVGNALKGLPELLVVGMYGDTFTLNKLSEMMIERGERFDDGQIVSLGGKHPVRVFDADDSVKDQYTIQASNYYGRERYDVMQVVLSDPDGKFPWQAGCAEPYRRVRIHRRNKVH